MSETQHLGDFAELYALGSLESAERTGVERHVSSCAACAQHLVQAERSVALMASLEPQYDAPAQLQTRVMRTLRPRTPWPTSALAIAAAIAVAVLPGAYFWQENQAMHVALSTDGQALSQIANAPHRLANFSPMTNGSMACVMYGHDGSWYVILVEHATKAVEVAWMHDGRRTMLGTAVPHGDVALLYLPRSHRMDRLALMDGHAVVAEAQLAY